MLDKDETQLSLAHLLPSEIMLIILSSLPLKQAGSLPSVCWYWRDLVYSDEFWNQMLQKYFPEIDNEYLKQDKKRLNPCKLFFEYYSTFQFTDSHADDGFVTRTDWVVAKLFQLMRNDDFSSFKETFCKAYLTSKNENKNMREKDALWHFVTEEVYDIFDRSILSYANRLNRSNFLKQLFQWIDPGRKLPYIAAACNQHEELEEMTSSWLYHKINHRYRRNKHNYLLEDAVSYYAVETIDFLIEKKLTADHYLAGLELAFDRDEVLFEYLLPSINYFVSEEITSKTLKDFLAQAIQQDNENLGNLILDNLQTAGLTNPQNDQSISELVELNTENEHWLIEILIRSLPDNVSDNLEGQDATINNLLLLGANPTLAAQIFKIDEELQCSFDASVAFLSALIALKANISIAVPHLVTCFASSPTLFQAYLENLINGMYQIDVDANELLSKLKHAANNLTDKALLEILNKLTIPQEHELIAQPNKSTLKSSHASYTSLFVNQTAGKLDSEEEKISPNHSPGV
jgi:hypothetical protein